MKINFLLTMMLSVFAGGSSIAQGIKIKPGTTFKLTGTPYTLVLTRGAHFENNEAVASPNLIIKATGNGTNEIRGTGALGIGTLQLSKTVGQGVQLQKNLDVAQAVSFGSGLLDLNGYEVTLADTAQLLNESGTSRPIGINGGSIQITQSLDAPLAENPGNLGLIITSGANWGSTLIKRSHQPYTQNGGNCISRNYQVVPTNNTGLSSFLRMYYLDAELQGLTENLLEFYRSDDNAVSWNNIGAAGRNATQNFVNISGVPNMALFTLSTNNSPLPIYLTKLTASCFNNKPSLQWRIDNPWGADYFIIEKSKDGSDWEIASSRIAAQPTVDYEYEFIDGEEPFNFYRLKSVGKDNTSAFSPIQEINCATEGDNFYIMQNPVNDVLKIATRSNNNLPISLLVYDMQGKQMLSTNHQMTPGANFDIDVSRYPAGIYQVKIIGAQQVLWQEKFVKQ